MNVTLSIPDEVVERSRAVAARRGTTLNQMIRDFLERESGASGDPALEALQRLEDAWATSRACSDGTKVTREELYAERLE